MAFAAVLFDMDGVVVDNMPLHREVWLDFARRHGLAPTDAELRALDGRRAHDIITTFFGEDTPLERIQTLARERELIYRDRLETAVLEPVNGALAFIELLGTRGVKRALATSAVPGNVQVVIERLGLQHAFEAVVTAADVKLGKPNPEVYLTAAARVGADPAHCLVIEDALPGLAAGVAARAQCLGLATSESEAALLAAGARWAARDFTRLPDDLRAALG